VRCHEARFGAADFWPSAEPARFRPVLASGRIVPSLYAAETERGALSERVFRNIPPLGGRGRHAATSARPPAAVCGLFDRWRQAVVGDRQRARWPPVEP